MTYTNKLRYAGGRPFKPEREREDITVLEREVLEQDETYQRLAEVRWLADELESEIARDDSVPNYAGAELFDAVAGTDAPLREAVDIYVDAWLVEHRAKQEVADDA